MASPSTASHPELFRLVVDQSPDALIFADKDGTVRVWNRSAADLFGYSPEEAIGQSLDLIIPEPLRPAHWEGYGQALAAGHTRHAGGALKTRATHKGGHRLYVSVAFAVVKDQAGEVIGAMATARELPREATA